jgi:DNA-binding NarL/FixJ family response regulator
MSHPSPALLLDANDREVRAMEDAVGRRALPLSIRVRSGEQALLWNEVHPCDACIIAPELPGLTGAQTMVRLHDRQSRLPVVVLSRAHGADPRR